MAQNVNGVSEGLQMYDELLAVHTIIRRGAVLTAAAMRRLAAGGGVDVKALVRAARWQVEFVHHHHASEDELFWPVLRRLFPDAVTALDELTVEHEALDAGLKTLGAAVDTIAAGPARRSAHGSDPGAAVRDAAREGAQAAARLGEVLLKHLDSEEPVLRELFPQVPDAELLRLRAAIVAGAPRSGPDLVMGLLHDPVPAPGAERLMANFPAPVRWMRPLLLKRYRTQKSALGQ
ncbi:hemerythrin domain-containing protein [Planotetraspora sp. GP83]|uniref:hemerythrin domain-containing protein n=1 Tax=Planotetraspora sp. GP83 TaxID=3156264 RepID=UPI00351488FB